MDFRKALKLHPLRLPTAEIISLHEKPQIRYPFNNCSCENDVDFIIAKILFVNFLESTQVKNKNMEALAKHIIKSVSESDYECLKAGELNGEYFSIV